MRKAAIALPLVAFAGAAVLAQAAAAPRTWALSFVAYGCTRVSARVQLAARGLRGGRASQFLDRYQCPAPRTVLVRVRLELARAASVGTRTRVPVSAAAASVRTATGTPIAYADVHESGRARLFTAPRCVAE